MAESNPIDQLDGILDAIASSPESADLLCVSAALYDLPDEDFKLRLKKELMQTANAASSYKPQGFRTLTPYLITGNASGQIDFLKQTFNAEEKLRFPTPSGGIMHAELRIDDAPVEMSDGSAQYPPAPSALHVYVKDVDAAYHRAIEAGGKSLFEPADREYGDREAGIADLNGNYWYIATHQQRPGAYIPEGLSSVTPFLHPKGAEGMIAFLIDAFGAKELARYPGPSGSIMHAKVQVGDSMIELGEAHDQWQPMPASLHLYVPNVDSVYDQALRAGGVSIQPVADQPYGERSGGVQDPYGNRWWIATYTAGER